MGWSSVLDLKACYVSWMVLLRVGRYQGRMLMREVVSDSRRCKEGVMMPYMCHVPVCIHRSVGMQVSAESVGRKGPDWRERSRCGEIAAFRAESMSLWQHLMAGEMTLARLDSRPLADLCAAHPRPEHCRSIIASSSPLPWSSDFDTQEVTGPSMPSFNRPYTQACALSSLSSGTPYHSTSASCISRTASEQYLPRPLQLRNHRKCPRRMCGAAALSA